MLDAARGGVVGNKIVICGGYNQIAQGPVASTYVGTIDASDPAIITWIQAGDYPSGPLSRHGGAGSLITSSGLVVFTGGDPDGSAALANPGTFAYDVISNTWKIGPDKPTPVNNLCNLATIVDNDSLYLAAVGGYDGAAIVPSNEWLNLGAYQIPTGIAENNSISTFDAYPNPLSDNTTINLSVKSTSEVKIVITDMLGNVLSELCNQNLSQGKHKFTWDATAISKGLYFCNIVIDGKTFSQKLVKM